MFVDVRLRVATDAATSTATAIRTEGLRLLHLVVNFDFQRAKLMTIMRKF